MTCNTQFWLAAPEPKPFGAEFVIVAPLLERNWVAVVECCSGFQGPLPIRNLFDGTEAETKQILMYFRTVNEMKKWNH